MALSDRSRFSPYMLVCYCSIHAHTDSDEATCTGSILTVFVVSSITSSFKGSSLGVYKADDETMAVYLVI